MSMASWWAMSKGYGDFDLSAFEGGGGEPASPLPALQVTGAWAPLPVAFKFPQVAGQAIR
jgi:hypothetical protein